MERTDKPQSNLLPCPFCGGEARPTAHLDNWFAPVCMDCGARGPYVKIARCADKQTMRELLNKADELWNMRVAATDASETLCVGTDERRKAVQALRRSALVRTD